ncbi:HNH endonuclease [Paenibacillus sp. UNCCL117]|uniref:HNH endonuclease n=1 Tax=unclassified Paenibacillus TaxID=185978 RepID=UPI00088D52D6|nr:MULTISPECIES: HNH endonuclease signature motif containing protein [unclassified Paenibacillus]SDD85544.1 HNH endonuclease [Paenibacillus sp. cl123]SFW54362.1 HNH endonuclease [Paenibacillus sp. UNCCL117]
MEENRRGISDKTAAELLDYKNTYKNNSISYYTLKTNELVSMKFSHLYKDGVGYWYGITPSTLEKYQSEGISHLCLILGYEGILKIPVSIVHKYMENADSSKSSSGGIKHYHLRIKYDEEVLLYNSVDKFIVNQYLIFSEEIIVKELNSKSMDQLKKEAEKFNDYAEQYIESEKRSKIRKESKAQKERIAKLEQHTCQVCGFYQEYWSKKGEKSWIIHVDHIVDKAKGGGETIDNLWVLCPNCHAKKTYGVIVVDKDNKIVKENGRVIEIKDNHLGWAL